MNFKSRLKLFSLLIILPIQMLMSFQTFGETLLINGAGATFPYPIYAKWFSHYRKVDPTVELNYQSIGSGGGIRQLLAGTTDFGASDAPMKEDEMKKSSIPILHIPTVMGAVALTYNLPGVKEELKMSSEVLSKIFLGEITKWDDEQIKKLNPTVKIPSNQFILVCYRADGSGTTAVFTEYLSQISSDWKSKVGSGKSVKWPTGLGGKGSEGLMGLVKQNPGAIGYVEMTYANQQKLPVFSIQNSNGEFIHPSVTSVTKAAAAKMKEMPSDFRISLTGASGKGAYPIAALTYLLVHSKMEGEKGKKIVNFLKWALKEGQLMASELDYAPLPKELLGQVNKKIDQIETTASKM